MNQIATLGSDAAFSIFSYGDRVIRFKEPYSLERYTAVKEWDNEYLVVMAKYRHTPHPEEEYIGLLPILNGLYIKRPGVFEADQGGRDCKWLLLSRSPMMRMLSSYKYLHI